MNKTFVPFLPPWVETGLQPAFYDAESGTVLQQTARMYAKVNQLTRHFNELSENVTKEINTFEQNINDTVDEYIDKFNQLHDYVYTYFDNLDVQEEINNKLDAMAESGELKEIMEPYFSELSDSIEELDEKIKSAYTINDLPLRRISRAIYDESNEDYYDLQGGCYVGDGKAIKALVKTDNDVKLVEFNLSTGVVIRSAVLGLGHCNGLAYDPEAGKIYASGLTGDYANNLYVIDYDTLTIDETLVLNVGENYTVASPAIDPVTGKMYISAEYYVNPHNIKFFEMDKETHALTEIAVNDPFNLLGITSNNQITAYNGVIYLVKFSPTLILGVDVKNNNISNIYNLPITSTESYWIRDPQFITFVYDGDPGEVIIGTNGEDCYRSGWNMNQFFKANLYSGTPITTSYLEDTSAYELYVDITATGVNPTGQPSNPFKTIGEALDFATDRKAITLYLVGDTSTVYPLIRIYPRHNNVTIRSKNSKCKINGIKASPTHTLKLVDVAFVSGADVLITSEQQANVIFSNVTVPEAVDNISLRNVALTVFNVPSDTVYNITCTGESNTFNRTSTGNLSKVHFGGTGNLVLLATKPLGGFNMTSTTTASDGIDLSADNSRLNNTYTIKYLAYFNYCRTFGNIRIPGKGGYSFFSFMASNYLIQGQLHRTNEDVVYAVVNKAFSIGDDGTLTDITSSASGTLAISLDNNIE